VKTNPIKANQSQLKPIKANKMPKQTQKNEKKLSKWVISCNIFTG
jgi:hypothetical protein